MKGSNATREGERDADLILDIAADLERRLQARCSNHREHTP